MDATLEMRLVRKIEGRRATVGVIGVGYVGLPLSLLLVGGGFRVVGYDVDGDHVRALQEGTSRVLDVPEEELHAALATGRLALTTDPGDLRPADVYLICVPTPLGKTRQPDLSHIHAAVDALLGVWEPGKLVVLESATYPGTTDEMLLPALASGGMEVDRDFLLAFSPERTDPGNTAHPLPAIPKVVGGVTPAGSRVAAALYATVFDHVHPVSNARVAELTQLLENTFRNVNIALVNEFSQICDALGESVWEVIEAAQTKPFGFMSFYPGPGIGGQCPPLDPQYLLYKARLSGYEPRLAALADRINQEMPRYVVRRAVEMLNDRGKAMRGARVLVAGVTYKPDVPDLRESPAVPILEELHRYGCLLSFADPLVERLRLPDGDDLPSVALDLAAVDDADLVILVTAHRGFDYGLLWTHAEKVLDTRNALAAGGRLALAGVFPGGR